MKILLLVSSMHAGGAERVAATLANGWAARGDQITLMPTYSSKGTCFYPLSDDVELLWLADRAGTRSGGVVAAWQRLRALRAVVRARARRGGVLPDQRQRGGHPGHPGPEDAADRVRAHQPGRRYQHRPHMARAAPRPVSPGRHGHGAGRRDGRTVRAPGARPQAVVRDSQSAAARAVRRHAGRRQRRRAGRAQAAHGDGAHGAGQAVRSVDRRLRRPGRRIPRLGLVDLGRGPAPRRPAGAGRGARAGHPHPYARPHRRALGRAGQGRRIRAQLGGGGVSQRAAGSHVAGLALRRLRLPQRPGRNDARRTRRPAGAGEWRDALRDALGRLMRDPELRRDLGRRAAQSVRQRYALPAVLAQWDALFERVRGGA